MQSPITTTFLFLLWVANCDNFSTSSSKSKEIISITNHVGQLPCPIVGGSMDDVSMILWFKDTGTAPIYSYDARFIEEQPRHLSQDRLYFRIWPTNDQLRSRSPSLIIKDVRASDEGSYRCRVDYKNAPTSNYVLSLKVIQPPSHLEILDTSSGFSSSLSDQKRRNLSTSIAADITVLGPYEEGQNITLTCNAYGGRPLPSVLWYRNHILIDKSYEFIGNNYAVNQLHLSSLGPEHSTELYTCQVSNNKESTPVSHSVHLDVYTSVKEIDFLLPDSEMTAGVESTLTCKTVGAYPEVKMEIWKETRSNKNVLLGTLHKKSDGDNVTILTIHFKPEIIDDEESVSCRAWNPRLKLQHPSSREMTASRNLRIKYKPLAILRFGQSKATNFTEGESVLMECHVKANPPAFSISWFHGTNQLESTAKDGNEGIVITETTLILKQLRAQHTGKYFCQPANIIGKEMSNPLTIQINIFPRCSSVPMEIPLGVGESRKLPCYIVAWPSPSNFQWALKRSTSVNNDEVPIVPMSDGNNMTRPTLDIPKEVSNRLAVIDSPDNIHHRAILSYTVRTEEDYGDVFCSARNELGEQLSPCVFHVVEGKGKQSTGSHDDTTAILQTDPGPSLFSNTKIPIFSLLLALLLIILTVLLVILKRKGLQIWNDRRDAPPNNLRELRISPRRRNKDAEMEPHHSYTELSSEITSESGTAVTAVSVPSTSHNRYPPPPISIISTSSTKSRGYGSGDEEVVEELV